MLEVGSEIDIEVLFKEVLGQEYDNYLLPPPSFTSMQAKIIAYDKKEQSIKVLMPILENTLNPYNTMQGGMIVAALDNAIGPLSMLTAPSNVTRRMTTEYRKPLKAEIKNIIVEAHFVEKKGRKLFFEGSIKDEKGTLYVTALAEQWIIK